MKIAIISDIHEDYISLMQAARLIEKKKCDEVICLGDIVGFSVPFYNYIDTRDGSACVKWVKNNCKYAIAGNHDLYAVRKVPVNQVRQFIYAENWYNLTFHKRKDIAQECIWLYEDNELSALLDEEDMQYLINLPEFMVSEIAGHTCLLSHFVFPDLSGSAKEFIYHYSDIVAHLGFMKAKQCTLGFSGHMHYEGMVRVSGKRMLKTGFGKKAGVGNFEWVSLPSVSNSKNANGFLVWDTENNIMEPVSLRRKFNFF